jgi:hypothetical protein
LSAARGLIAAGNIRAETALIARRSTIVGKSHKHKHTKRGNHYRTMAAGYEILRSPLADSYHAAAEHYHESDPPLDPLADPGEPGSGTGVDKPGRDAGLAER